MSEELTASSNCPVCGYDKPHAHTNEEVEASIEDKVYCDGWTSTVLKRPSKRGWYLCLGVAINPDQFGKPTSFPNRNEGWAQLSWFIWVRGAATEGQFAGHIPEVLFFDPMDGWHLRNSLGNAVRSGAESRRRVYASPKYWRELPAVRRIE